MDLATGYFVLGAGLTSISLVGLMGVAYLVLKPRLKNKSMKAKNFRAKSSRN